MDIACSFTCERHMSSRGLFRGIYFLIPTRHKLIYSFEKIATWIPCTARDDITSIETLHTHRQAAAVAAGMPHKYILQPAHLIACIQALRTQGLNHFMFASK